MKINLTVETDVSRSIRARQLEGMFDVPAAPHQTRKWTGSIPIETDSWSVGAILGPSGSGKSTILKGSFGEPATFDWSAPSVIDAFPADAPIDTITSACQAVGFNTIPAWLRPYAVLSNGEQFRAGLARVLVETPADQLMLIDEFTSVVDRQVAQIASHAVAKWVRRNDRQLVVASCHYDIVDWLQPDWVLEPATMDFRWRSVQPRPQLDVTITPVHHSAWRLFAPFHYLTADLNKAAKCYVLWVGDEPATFEGILHRPHARVRDIKALSRTVTLPDWQGLGLAFAMKGCLGAAYKAAGWRLRSYPAHPAFIRSHDRSLDWRLVQRPAQWNARHGPKADAALAGQGRRPNAVFEYAGAPDERAASELGVPRFERVRSTR